MPTDCFFFTTNRYGARKARADAAAVYAVHPSLALPHKRSCDERRWIRDDEAGPMVYDDDDEAAEQRGWGER